jgi:hypothetical protein
MHPRECNQLATRVILELDEECWLLDTGGLAAITGGHAPSMATVKTIHARTPPWRLSHGAEAQAARIESQHLLRLLPLPVAPRAGLVMVQAKTHYTGSYRLRRMPIADDLLRYSRSAPTSESAHASQNSEVPLPLRKVPNAIRKMQRSGTQTILS